MEKFQHGGQIYDEFGNAVNFLDFSANINPLGLSEKISETLTENFAGVVNYPDPNATELKNSISRRYKVSQENLILLNGAAEFFYLFCNVFRPKKILIPVPSFSEYERAAKSSGAEVEFFFTKAEENFQLDVKKLLEKNADCIILGRPNNPTGNLISIEEILKLAEKFSVVVDESFIDFLPIESVRNFLTEKIFVVQSLTKIFAIPGLRLGFAVAEKNFAEKLNFAKDVWNVNFLAQKAGVAALSDEKFLQDTRNWLEVEKKYFAEKLREFDGVKVFEPSVNFILIQLENKKIAENILEKFREKNILVRNCENFTGLGGRFLRLAIRSREENNLLLKSFSAIITNC
ncbi:MAG: aminotransferase class I/II-fold pyridoxal phosphate-dependent enzyme [Selenomonadaceae bacterium]|nr:aminotransferase class I/II-fold pyridoxal phosphate-dependent enzyme [Selenomonadaceae bacterium]